MRSVLITGAAGFVGAYAAEEFVRHGFKVISLDALTYAGSLNRLANLTVGRICNVVHDLSSPIDDATLKRIGDVSCIVHMAAESHVPRSLNDPLRCVRSNVLGTVNILEAARRLKPDRFIYVSTDEVFGPSHGRAYACGDLLNPSNPYSATKAGGEFVAGAYRSTFGVPVLVTRCVNMFGKKQNPEKFIPLAVKNIIGHQRVDIHTSSDGIIGSRHWAYAGDHARAIVWLSGNGVTGETYHVSRGTHMTNLEMGQRIADILGIPWWYALVAADRPGHDMHYDIEESALSRNWKTNESFDSLLARTVRWMRDNPGWLE